MDSYSYGIADLTDREFVDSLLGKPYDAWSATDHLRVLHLAVIHTQQPGPNDEGYPGIAHDFETMRKALESLYTEYCAALSPARRMSSVVAQAESALFATKDEHG